MITPDHISHKSFKTHKLYWEVSHPPYSSDLLPCDLYLFGPSKKLKCINDDEVKKRVITQQKTFYKKGIMKLTKRWKRCITFNGEFDEEEYNIESFWFS